MVISIQEWASHYMPKLRDAGIRPDDAREAVLLGWDISYAHQACYGDDNTPIHFNSDPHPHAELEGFVACAPSQQCNGSPDNYSVFAFGIADRIVRVWRETGGAVEHMTIRLGLAVHEVRHRVQARESSLLQFRREYVCGKRWTDEQAMIVALHMDDQYRDDERKMRAKGVADSLIKWQLSDSEFDADIVERLFLLRAPTVQTVDELAMFIRMPAPILLF